MCHQQTIDKGSERQVPEGFVATRDARIRARIRSNHLLATSYTMIWRAVHAVVRSIVRPAAFRAAIAVLALRGRGCVPSRRVLRLLRYGWANDYAASLEYLEEVARQAIAARGSIVEAGSGLTTIVLSHITRRDQIIVSLEHLPQWAERVSRHISEPGTHRLLLRPLTKYDGYDWYAIGAEDVPSDVALAIVDGPPGNTRGGRYGALPNLAPRFGSDVVVLLDDVHRSGEKQVLAKWAREFGIRAEVRGDGSRVFAVMRIPQAGDCRT